MLLNDEVVESDFFGSDSGLVSLSFRFLITVTYDAYFFNLSILFEISFQSSRPFKILSAQRKRTKLCSLLHTNNYVNPSSLWTNEAGGPGSGVTRASCGRRAVSEPIQE
jgi:hypothetical protein